MVFQIPLVCKRETTITPSSVKINASHLTGCGKTLWSPFDELRTNGDGIEIIEVSPFMLSLSKHSQDLFSILLTH